MPAFLMAVPTPKKRPIAQIETGLNEEKDVEIRVESKNISLESFDDATSIKAEVEE